MKKTLYLFALILLSGCSYLRQPVSQVTYAFDYKKYTDEGFFITESNSVSFDYKPVSSVHSIFLSGFELKEPKAAKQGSDDLYGEANPLPQTTNKYIQATQEKVIEELYKKAKSLNANAMINLQVKVISYYDYHAKMYVMRGYEGSAMAIVK